MEQGVLSTIYFFGWQERVGQFFAYVRARICKRLWRPGRDSEDLILPAYVAWRAGTINRVVVPARQAGNRFLGSLQGLQIRALDSKPLSCRCLQLSQITS
jgi:hypothetical protein